MNKFDFFIFKQIIFENIQSSWKALLDRIINIIIWVLCTMFVLGYIMPLFGLAQNFGVFQFATVLATAGFFQIFDNVINLVLDFTHTKKIDSYLILPTTSITIFSALLFLFALYGVIIVLTVLSLAKFILWNYFSFSQVYWTKFILVLIISNIFFGVFSLLLASRINMNQIGNVWSRLLFPMWFLGGFQFSWYALNKVIPKLSYLFWLNPLMLISESMRVVILGQEGFLNFWACTLSITILTIFGFILSLKLLKKRLDFV